MKKKEDEEMKEWKRRFGLPRSTEEEKEMKRNSREKGEKVSKEIRTRDNEAFDTNKTGEKRDGKRE